MFWQVFSNFGLVNVGFSGLSHCVPDLVDPVSLDVAGAGQHRLESSQLEVIVGLLGKLFITKSEEWNNLPRQLLRRSESLREESDLGNHREVRGRHGQGPEQLLQIVWQIGSASVGGILENIQLVIKDIRVMTNVYHCDEYRHVLVDPDLLAHQLHRGVGLVRGLDREMLLDCLNLL